MGIVQSYSMQSNIIHILISFVACHWCNEGCRMYNLGFKSHYLVLLHLFQGIRRGLRVSAHNS